MIEKVVSSRNRVEHPGDAIGGFGKVGHRGVTIWSFGHLVIWSFDWDIESRHLFANQPITQSSNQ
jgi:hypothetical protein